MPAKRFRSALADRLRVGAFLIAAVLVSSPTLADIPPPSSQNAAGAPTKYQQYLMKSATVGPASVRLRDQAVLALPQGAAFLPQAPAKALMQRLGNETDDNFLGIVLPWEESDWFIILEFIPSGYVADDDAKNWNADDLLKSIRDNTEKENAERKKQGVPELDILGWVEKPHYDNANHRLIWSILAKQKGAQAASNIINYKMLALGRQGYISLVMVTDAAVIQARKPIAAAMLSHVSFTGGRRYTDFNASTDRVAEYGLAALIGGVVIHKLGFFALIAAFFVKGAKFLVVLAAGALAAVRRFFRRGKPAEAPTRSLLTDTAPPPPPPAEPQP
ncbi:MAG TPA: DUF2167 domain-containing protein [Rhizomicrobium sp.]|nr:DUF2167 domain-containing protein [Rhizomicrobium sp.]